MPISHEILAELAALREPLRRVEAAVDRALNARLNPFPPTAETLIEATEQAIQAWLERSDAAQQHLLEYIARRSEGESEGEGEGPRDDAASDAIARLGGLALLHSAVACDVALLVPLDELQPEEPAANALRAASDWTSTIQDTAFGEGNVLDAMSTPDDAAAAHPIKAPSVASALNVVEEIVERATKGATAVLLRIAPAPTAAFAAVAPLLQDALALAPDDIASAVHDATRRVARLVRLAMRKAHELLEAVSARYREAVTTVLEACDLKELLAESAVARLLRRIYKPQLIASNTHACLRRAQMNQHVSQKELDRRLRSLQKLARTNRRWVGPVRIVAKGLQPLWAVSAAGVPAAPVVACGLLAWTILLTGDQLDAGGPYPDFWDGPRRIAAGR